MLSSLVRTGVASAQRRYGAGPAPIFGPPAAGADQSLTKSIDGVNDDVVGNEQPAELSLSRLARHLGRALLLRCPHCGRGTLFKTWLRMHTTCRSCRLRFERTEEGGFIGAYLLNLIAAELVIVLAGTVIAVATWPDVPWDALKWGLVTLMIPFPFLTYPYSKAIWLAVDLHFQPATPMDFDAEPGRA
jgi:uncharacterized protein (DUF983 family)